MADVECVVKRWGSSLGIIIPSEIVKREHLKADEVIQVNVKKVPLAKILWGLAPERKISAQKAKDWMKSQW